MLHKKLLLKNVRIVSPESKHHDKKRDILIEEDQIKEIKAKISDDKAKVFDAKGAFCSLGWVDLGTQIGDPGYEHREDIQSISKAAAAGGFTALAMLPNTNPIIQSKSEIQYLISHSKNTLVDILPIGAASHDCSGEDITEMYDMHQAGAYAFSDGKRSIQDSGLMMRALQYVKAFDGVVMNYPQNASIAGKGQMNEGTTSTMLGTKGIPRLAEELMVQRDIYLAEYADSRVHISNISTAGSVELIRQAKKKGIKITASVPALQLAFDDSVLADFDSNFKVLPPLREPVDIKALHKGLLDGSIDVICSNHVPLENEAKSLEFSYAKFGAIGLETTFALCSTHLGEKFTTEILVEKLCANPRKLLGLPNSGIAVGNQADLTIFEPNIKWNFTKADIFSKSKNTGLIGKELKGRPLGIVKGNQHFFIENI